MSLMNQVGDYLVTKTIRAIGGPEKLAMQIDITNACNLSCSHCYHAHHKNKGAIKLDGWFEIFKPI